MTFSALIVASSPSSAQAHPQIHYLLMSLNFAFGWHWDTIKLNASIEFHIKQWGSFKGVSIDRSTMFQFDRWQRNSIFYAFILHKRTARCYTFRVAGDSYIRCIISPVQCLHNSEPSLPWWGSWQRDALNADQEEEIINKRFIVNDIMTRNAFKTEPGRGSWK